jgi:hypothetical protein
VRLAVPALELGGAVEAEVGAEIDERDAGLQQFICEPLGFAVGKSGEDQVAAAEQRGVSGCEGGIRIG